MSYQPIEDPPRALQPPLNLLLHLLLPILRRRNGALPPLRRLFDGKAVPLDDTDFANGDERGEDADGPEDDVDDDLEGEKSEMTAVKRGRGGSAYGVKEGELACADSEACGLSKRFKPTKQTCIPARLGKVRRQDRHDKVRCILHKVARCVEEDVCKRTCQNGHKGRKAERKKMRKEEKGNVLSQNALWKPGLTQSSLPGLFVLN